MDIRENEMITPEKAAALLQKNGMEVTPEQAKQIVDFLYKLADITVFQYMVMPS